MDVSLVPPQVNRLEQVSPFGAEARSSRLPFQMGQLVQAQVLGSTEDGRFLLDIAQQQFTAASTLSLTPGTRLDLQVTATQPQIELRLLADPLTQRISGALYLLPRMDTLLPLLQSLTGDNASLSALPPEMQQVMNEWLAGGQSLLQQGTDGGTTLHRLLQDLGLNQERLLAQGQTDTARHSLKQVLLAAADSPRLTAEQKESAASLVQLFDLLQLLRLRLDTADLLFFPLPLPFLEQGYLLADRDTQDDGGQEGTKPPRYTLLLRLGGLGNLRIDMTPGPEGLVINFHCEDQDKARFVAAFREELLATISTTVQGVSFLTGATDPVQHLLHAGDTEQSQLLDTRA